MQNEDIHFEPIVHLEEVEVKTGEEEETAIYSQRSKLFRFTDGQWKERGIGDMRILKHNSTGVILYNMDWMVSLHITLYINALRFSEKKIPPGYEF